MLDFFLQAWKGFSSKASLQNYDTILGGEGSTH